MIDKPEDETATAATPPGEIEAVTNPQQLYDFLAARLPPPGRITNLSLFCEGSHADRILCLVDLAGISAGVAAKALEGQPFAFSSVFLSVPVGPNFTCRVRQHGKRPEGSCSCGHNAAPTHSLLDRD